MQPTAQQQRCVPAAGKSAGLQMQAVVQALRAGLSQRSLCTDPHEDEGQLERVGHALARLLWKRDKISRA